jgi:3-hydroxyacyl-[acyl-carrier-protein] dehydratase
MASEPLFDLSKFDLTRTVASREGIEATLPHRGEMVQIDRIIWADHATMCGIAERRVRDDEFWVEGHIPGRPLLPGVLMIEAAAQLGCWVYIPTVDHNWFVGLVRVEDVICRGMAEPGDVLYFLVRGKSWTQKRMVMETQAIKDGQIIFEGRVVGMPLRISRDDVKPSSV